MPAVRTLLLVCLLTGVAHAATLAATPAAAHAVEGHAIEEPPIEDYAAGEAVPGVAPPTGLPVPRFVSLRSGEVNVRTGPGTRYPVEWVFLRKDIPVEITAEFDTWRRIRDWEGAEGWVHQSMLSGRRAIVVTGEVRSLRRSPALGAPAVARVEPGVVGSLIRCRDAWCEVDIQGYEGWLEHGEFWGVYPKETVE